MGLATSLACGGTALPEALPAARPSTVPQFPGAPEMPNRQFTRPLCVYPEFATYRGSGNPDAAASFECMTP